MTEDLLIRLEKITVPERELSELPVSLISAVAKFSSQVLFVL